MKSPTLNALLDVETGKNAIYPLLGFSQADIERFHERRGSKPFLVRILAQQPAKSRVRLFNYYLSGSQMRAASVRRLRSCRLFRKRFLLLIGHIKQLPRFD